MLLLNIYSKIVMSLQNRMDSIKRTQLIFWLEHQVISVEVFHGFLYSLPANINTGPS